MRVLSTRFLTYNVYKLKKNNNKNLLDMLDIGNLEIDKIVDLMRLGNKQEMTEEELCQKLDDYLGMDGEHSYISAYLELLDELDKDTKILSSMGFSVKQLRESMLKEMKSNVEGLVDPVIKKDEV